LSGSRTRLTWWRIYGKRSAQIADQVVLAIREGNTAAASVCAPNASSHSASASDG
jgi:hypothetical protein